MRTIPAIFTLFILCACGSDEPEVLTNAQQVHEAYANNLEQAAEAREGQAGERLERAAELHERRAEVLEERPGEIAAQPVILDTKNKGVEGTAWNFESNKAN